MSKSNRESLKICNECGQIYDANIEAQALHHDRVVHEPLLPPWKLGQKRLTGEFGCAA